MPGRKYNAGSGYRYGLNGQEKTDEITKDDYDFGARIYDARLGKWLSVDPLQKKYPNESPYAFVSDNPIFYKDADGKEKIVTITILNKDGSKTILKMVDKNYFNYHTVKGTFSTAYQDRDHKESISLNYIVDNSGDQPIITQSVYAYDINSNYTWEQKLIDWGSDFLNNSPRKFGWSMFGGGDGISPAAQMEWNSNLPTSENTESLGNISSLLEVAGNWREFDPLTKDGDIFKHEIYQFYDNPFLKKLMGGTVDNLLDAILTAQSAIEDNSSTNTTINTKKGTSNPVSIDKTKIIHPFAGIKPGSIVHPLNFPPGSNIKVLSDTTGQTSSKPAKDTVHELH